jgi:hypothetical protein
MSLEKIDLSEMPEPLQWVIREQEFFIPEIKRLQAQVDQLRQAPRSGDEVASEVCRHLGKAQSELRKVMERYQTRQIDEITSEMLMPVVLASALPQPQVREIAMGLPRATSKQERERKIATLREKIQGLIAELESECWPIIRGNPNESGLDGGLEWLRDWSYKSRNAWLHPITGVDMPPGSPMGQVGHYFHIGPGFDISSWETLQTLRLKKIEPFYQKKPEVKENGNE